MAQNGELTDKQEMFCLEYVKDFNGTQAAIRAGYSEKTANEQAAQNLAKLSISRRIQELMAERKAKVKLDAEFVLGELMKLANVDASHAFDSNGDLLPIHDMPEDLRKSIASVETIEYFKEKMQVGWLKKVKFWDKPKSLELLGRNLRLFVEKLEVTGKDGGPLEIKGSNEQIDQRIAELTAKLELNKNDS